MQSAESIENLPQLYTSPSEYLSCFRDSDAYKSSYAKFYEGKTLSDEVSDIEKKEAFEKDETCRKTLIDFARTQDIILKYDPEYYNKEFKDNVKEYFLLIEDFQKGRVTGREGIVAYDRLRGLYHDASAQILTESLGVPHRLARGLIQVMTVHRGLETFDSAGQDERRRVLSTLR